MPINTSLVIFRESKLKQSVTPVMCCLQNDMGHGLGSGFVRLCEMNISDSSSVALIQFHHTSQLFNNNNNNNFIYIALIS